MGAEKNRKLKFIIPKPVHEVKALLASYKKRSMMRHIKIEFNQSQNNMNEWQVFIQQSDQPPIQSSRMYSWRIKFSGHIRYHTVDSTEFERQIYVSEMYEDHFATNMIMRIFSILLILAFGGFLLSLIPANPTMLTMVGIVSIILTFVLIVPYMIRHSKISAQEAVYNTDKDVLNIIRELAPDDVII